MKKTLAIMLSVLLFAVLCACEFSSPLGNKGPTPTDTASLGATSSESDVSSASPSTDTSSDEKPEIDDSQTQNPSDGVAENGNKNENQHQNGNTGGNGGGNTGGNQENNGTKPTPTPTPVPTPTPNPPTPPAPPPAPPTVEVLPPAETVIPPTTNQSHQSIAADKYYQYTQMNEREKSLYVMLKSAANSYQNEVNVEGMGFTMDEVSSVIRRFEADHPQYFWIAREFGFTYYGSPDNLATCHLLYTDGSTKDSMDGTVSADRTKIAQQRKEVENKVKEIAATVKTDATDYEKELFIHDYLVNNMAYDHDAAANPNISGSTVLKPAFSVLGAFINNKGVCEAYSKAFQYLCYEVGINANQVTSSNHMWNVVELEGEWYQVDVTWDDPSNIEMLTHTYMNLTSAAMYAVPSHTPNPETSGLKVPDCTATKYKHQNSI